MVDNSDGNYYITSSSEIVKSLIYLFCFFCYYQSILAQNAKVGYNYKFAEDFVSKVINVDVSSVPSIGFEGSLRNPAKYYMGFAFNINNYFKPGLLVDMARNFRYSVGFSLSIIDYEKYNNRDGFSLMQTIGWSYLDPQGLTSNISNSLETIFLSSLIFGNAFGYKSKNFEVNAGYLYFLRIAMKEHYRYDIGLMFNYKNTIKTSLILREYKFDLNGKNTDLTISYSLDFIRFFNQNQNHNFDQKNEIKSGIVGSLCVYPLFENEYDYEYFYNDSYLYVYTNKKKPKVYLSNPALFFRYGSGNKIFRDYDPWSIETFINLIEKNFALIISFKGMNFGVGYTHKDNISSVIPFIPARRR